MVYFNNDNLHGYSRYQGSTHRLVRAPVGANWYDIFQFFRCWHQPVLVRRSLPGIIVLQKIVHVYHFRERLNFTILFIYLLGMA